MTKIERQIQARIVEIEREITGVSLSRWTVGIAKIGELRRVLNMIKIDRKPDIPEITRVWAAAGPSPVARF